jgi:hypothetical protein
MDHTKYMPEPCIWGATPDCTGWNSRAPPGLFWLRNDMGMAPHVANAMLPGETSSK